MFENLIMWIVVIGSIFQLWVWDYNHAVKVQQEILIEKEKQRQIELSKIPHQKTPEQVKSIYYTAGALNYWPKRENLFQLLETSEINSVILDIKTISGYINFQMPDTHFTTIQPASNNQIWDIKSELKLLHEKWAYIIGRVVVFKDNRIKEIRPDLNLKWKNTNKVWEDYSGNSYSDAGSQEIWDYHAAIAKTAFDLWFDEINFDYVRFPTDGKINDVQFPFSWEIISQNPTWWKIQILENFWAYINKNIKNYKPEIVTSADVFWLVTNNDMFQIWQNLESFLLHFDYVAPMIYPSHYWAGFLWYKQPDNNPYEIFQYALNWAKKRIDWLNLEIKNAQNEQRNISILWKFDSKISDISNIWEIKYTNIRPWLQWFSCTRCSWATPYTTSKFRKQIQALEDAWMNSWFVWSAWSNYYPQWYNWK